MLCHINVRYIRYGQCVLLRRSCMASSRPSPRPTRTTTFFTSFRQASHYLPAGVCYENGMMTSSAVNTRHGPRSSSRYYDVNKSHVRCFTTVNCDRVSNNNNIKPMMAKPIHFITERCYSDENKDFTSLAERFRNDSDVKSFMQELLSDFERSEPLTKDERCILKDRLGFEPTYNNNNNDAKINKVQKKIETLVEEQDQFASRPIISEDLEPEIVKTSDTEQVFHEKDRQHKTKDRIDMFSIDEIVDMLKEENATDLCVIRLPKKMKYVDYMVFVTGRSTRHLKAITQNINKRYKEMKLNTQPFLKLEGRNSHDWMCIDFGNIVVHVMLEETRELYELEKLWTLGPKFDDQIQRMDTYEVRMFNVQQDLNIVEEEDSVVIDDDNLEERPHSTK